MFGLPDDILFKVLTFLLNDYAKLIKVSPLWYYKINESIENAMVRIDNEFIKSYMSFLSFKQSYITINPIKFNNLNGMRMDRNIVTEVLPFNIGSSLLLCIFNFK